MKKYQIPHYSRSEITKNKKKRKRSVEHKNNLKKSQAKTFLRKHKESFNLYLDKWSSISDIDWEWMAGFWEGEGYIGTRIIKSYDTKDFRMCVSQNDTKPLLYMQDVLQTGKIYKNNDCNVYKINKLSISILFILKIEKYIKSDKRKKQIEYYKSHEIFQEILLDYIPKLKIGAN